MNSKAKLRENLEYIRSLEEKARLLYESYLPRLSGLSVRGAIAEIRNEEARHVQIAEEMLAILKKYETLPVKDASRARFRLPLPALYAGIGVILGLGSPLGAVLFKYLAENAEAMSRWFRWEMAEHVWYYLYMTIGSVIVCGAAAWSAGTLYERLRSKARDLTAKARVLEDISEKDALTGLFNFGTIRERLAIEIERSRRFQTPLSCLMVDIDNMKSINDEHGHPAGDRVIRAVAELIAKEVRVIDTATRYGGDEFFIMLPVTAKAGAFVVAERIRTRLKALAVEYQASVITPAVSVGIATFPSPLVIDAETLVEAADQALYEAKRIGRDRTVQVAN